MASGNAIKISILANARDAVRGLRRTAKAVQDFDRKAKKSASGLKSFSRELGGLGFALKAATGSLKVGGQVMGAGLMGFVALGIASGVAQVTSALTAGLLAALPAVGVLPGFAIAAASAVTVLKVAISGLSDVMKLGLQAQTTGAAKDIAAYDKALAKLSPHTAAAVREMVALRPALLNVRNAISGAFFGGFASEIKILAATYLPMLSQHGQAVAGSLNRAARGLSAFSQKNSTVDTMAGLFRNVEKSVDNVSRGVVDIARGLLPLASVSTSFLPGLTSGFRDATERFSKFMETAEKTGKLQAFIQSGLTALKAVVGILGDVGSIFKSVFVDANTGAGTLFASIGVGIKELKNFLNTARGMQAVGAVWKGLGTVGTALGNAMKTVLPALGEALTTIGPAIGPLAGTMSRFLATLAPLLPVVANVAVAISGQLGGAFAATGPMLAQLGTSVGKLAIALTPLIGAIAKAATAVGDGLSPAIDNMLPALDPFIKAFGGALVTAATALGQLLPPIGTALGEVLAFLTPLLPASAGLGTSIASGLVPHIGTLTKLTLGAVVAWKAYRLAVTACTTATNIFDAVGGARAAFKSSTLGAAISSRATRAWTAVQRGATAAMAALRAGIIATTIAHIRSAAATVATKIAALAATAANYALAAAMAVVRGAVIAWTAVQWLLNAAILANPITWIIVGIVALVAVVVLIATKTTWFQTIWRVTWGAIKTATAAVFTWLASAFTRIVTTIKTAWTGIMGLADKAFEFRTRVISVFVGWLNWMLALPGKIIDGMMRGLTAGWQRVTNFFRDAIELIPQGIRDALGIASPSKVMASIGAQVGKGLVGGIRGQVPAIRKVMKVVAGTVSTGVATDTAVKLHADATVTGAGVRATANAPQVTVNVMVAAGADPAEVGRKTVAAIEAWQTRTGRRRLLPA